MTSIVERTIRNVVTKGIKIVADRNRNAMKSDAPNPYLSGLHEPMNEELTLTELSTSGEIPAELDGTYMRIGPNQLTTTNAAAHHWFVGDGMVHGIRIRNGKAEWYRNRWVRSNAVSEALGEAPKPGPRRALSDNANTNVLDIGGRIYALVEASANPVELDGELSTVAHSNFDGTLDGTFAAHPHRDPETGELHAICYDAQEPNVARYVVVDTSGKVRKNELIAVKHGPSIHDCMITENYVVILDLPVTFSMRALVQGHGFPFRWNADHKARVGLLPRDGKGSDVIWCDVDPCYVFHAANAYEHNGEVIIDVVAYERMFEGNKAGPDSQKSRFERWTVNPQKQTTTRQVFHGASQEFPRCDERRLGKPYRYAYAVAAPEENNNFSLHHVLYRHDLVSGRTDHHDFGADRHPGELVFIPNGPDETDGYLMGLIVDARTQTTDLVILDAANFGKTLASIRIPHRVPPGFHGNWIASV